MEKRMKTQTEKKQEKHRITYKGECSSCNGTGLYVGMCESNGAAVVCHSCDGEGFTIETIKWKEFGGLKTRSGVKRVFASSCGIGLGEDPKKGIYLADFGGIPYSEWKSRKNRSQKDFPIGSEMRKWTCPAWFYQSVDYCRKPNWKECPGVGSFSNCSYFKNKHLCWERFDKESKKK